MFSLTSILPLGSGPDVARSRAARKRDRAASGQHEASTPELGESASSEKKGPGEGGQVCMTWLNLPLLGPCSTQQKVICSFSLVQRNIQGNHRLSGWTTPGSIKPILISAPENVTPAATGQPWGRMYPVMLSARGQPRYLSVRKHGTRQTLINLKMGQVKKGKQSKIFSMIPSTYAC